MNTLLVLLFAVTCASAGIVRQKRHFFALPDGTEIVAGGAINTTFKCKRSGYFADVENNCQVFHVCNQMYSTRNNEPIFQRYSFLCGNMTMFDQVSLTCNFLEDSLPCQNAPDFFHLNDNLGQPDQPFLTEEELQKAGQMMPRPSRPVPSREVFFVASTHTGSKAVTSDDAFPKKVVRVTKTITRKDENEGDSRKKSVGPVVVRVRLDNGKEVYMTKGFKKDVQTKLPDHIIELLKKEERKKNVAKKPESTTQVPIRDIKTDIKKE